MLEENTGNFSSTKTKHDWYQTQSYVTITVLIRNLNENDVNIEFSSDSLSCVCKLSDGTQYDLHLNLFKPIIVSQSNWKLSVSKLEINLKKQEPIRWSNLEAIPSINKIKTNKTNSNTSAETQRLANDQNEDNSRDDNQTNTSIDSQKSLKIGTKDWDQILKDFEKEEEEECSKGEGSVDQLFKTIYEKGGEEVRRAMNKSFTESGGTVLSTNWKEVSKSKVEVKPPDGCELKQWDH
jgi:suppressor of G2 allele of SKP1